ncbi:MAG: type II toxin-antitoxin system RelE/ParE family toxin [Elusimicrobia bacterium]|nr:type II toxin-antitoxin system RelE/ParE family toxin [Elusimicrobiota bacterium]
MNSKFSIELSSHSTKDLKKLAKTNRKLLISIAKSIDSLGRKPYSGKPLKGDLKGCFSLRVGDYRVIYEVYPKEKTVLIIRVGHRKDIYR